MGILYLKREERGRARYLYDSTVSSAILLTEYEDGKRGTEREKRMCLHLVALRTMSHSEHQLVMVRKSFCKEQESDGQDISL